MSQAATPSSLANLFQSGGASIGVSPAASGVIIQNLNATVAPMCMGGALTADEEQTDDFRLVCFVFDMSGSMDVVADMLRESVNEVLIPGLLGGAASQVGAIRYNGISFNDRIQPLWQGSAKWKSLKDEPLKLDASAYRPSGSTALNRAIIDAITMTAGYALNEIVPMTGSLPKCTIAVLSDGANNQPPLDSADVRTAVTGLSPELYEFLFLGFETGERVDFRQIARDLGFRPEQIEDSKQQPGETPDAMRKRMRNKMGVWSQSITNSASRSTVGSKSGSSGSTAGGAGTSTSGIWNP